jgi:hypothetical protein
MLTFPLFEETFGTFLFLSLSLSLLALSLEDLGVLMIFEEKITSSKTSFQLASIYCGGCIFRSGVMHANVAKS